jgi:hypothetical protein
MQSLRHLHLALVCCIIRYLRGSPSRDYSFLPVLLALLHLVMLIGLDVLILVALLLDGACFLATP